MPKALPSQGISNARLTATVKEGGTLVPPRPFLKTDASNHVSFAVSGAAGDACVVLGSAGGEYGALAGADGRKEFSLALE